ncbi:transketolase [Candidatus Babeliales bacterium]|nr:transketolase [Candidatus Babeliales bacterium]
MSNNILFLKNKALNLRIDSIRATTQSKSGHPTSALSAADIIAVLFFHTMQYDPTNPKNPSNDRFILSKGHAIPLVYAAWKQAGVINDKKLMSLRKFDSELEGHPTPRFEYNEAATGSLGQGLSIGVGEALSAKIDNLEYKIYVMIGDGEAAEGSIWEAAEIASYYKLNNLIGILDCNRLGQSGESIHDHDIEIYRKKFEAFGWNSIKIDGHNFEEIIKAFENAANSQDKPTMIIAKTFKGYGLENGSNKIGFHGKPLPKEESEAAIEHLKKEFSEAFEYSNNSFSPSLPEKKTMAVSSLITLNIEDDPNAHLFGKETKLATRKAYGYALAALGRKSENVIVLDADVKNSTFTEIFETEFPNRFFQCFIAEQNMIGVATGLELRGKIPFVATFGAFLTRAFDQIRMAGIGRNALRLCGSHCGVSIGEDGPSQMALEDLGMIRSIPKSIIFYPSDAVSTYKIMEHSANYNEGISYIRTTRMNTKNIYDKNETFSIGGCKVVKKEQNAQACIVAAGITLHEALKAHDILKNKNIFVSVIDLYSIKPIDRKTILEVALNSQNKILTVEDHYGPGGIGEIINSAVVNNEIIVKNLYVKKISRSGNPSELLADAEIDSAKIIEVIKDII